jgi:uncharacterized protein YceK
MNLSRQIAAAIVASLLFGCGTISNVNSMNGPVMGAVFTVRPRPFGGVVNDLTWPFETDPAALPWALPMYIIDLPMSIVGDVLTLPTIRERQIEFDKHRESTADHADRNSDTTSESS